MKKSALAHKECGDARDCLSYKDLFEEQEIEQFLSKCPKHRKRIYPPDAALISFVSQALTGNSSCKEVVENVLVDRLRNGFDPCSLNTSSYVRSRQKLPLEPIKELTKEIARKLELKSPLDWRWMMRKVRLIDGSTVGMADTKENQKDFPQNLNQKEGCGYPLSRIALVTSLETGTVMDFAMGPFMGKKSSELFLGKGLLKSLDPGDVLVGDAYFLNYGFVGLAQQRGLDFLAIKKKNAKFVEISSHKIGENDRIIVVEKVERKDERFTWIEKEEFDSLPSTLRLRETTVTIQKNGFRTRKLTLLSTFANPYLYTANDLADLFFSRWNIETDLRVIKRILNMDFLNSKTPGMVQKECWVDLLAYNLVRRLMNQVGIQLTVRPRLLSYKQILAFVTIFFSKISGAMDRYYLLKDALPFLGKAELKPRPHRFEPRTVKVRRGKNAYPDLKMTRKRWKMLQIWPHLDLKFSKALTIEIEKLMKEMINQTPKHKRSHTPYTSGVSS